MPGVLITVGSDVIGLGAKLLAAEGRTSVTEPEGIDLVARRRAARHYA